uniref:Post-GPI attachment to proteins factor 2-like n=1 Tax=Strongyloides venezuelensis TaxID=75913 RepID=A0A0K0G158_STRVS
MSAEIDTKEDNTTIIKLQSSKDDSICCVGERKKNNFSNENRFESIHPIRRAPEYSVKEICKINPSLFVALGFFPPFLGAFGSIFMALVFHYDLISNYNWQCGRARFPSISRIINLPLERIPWQLFVLFHVPFRVIELCVGHVRYNRLMSVHCKWPRFYNFSRLCYTTFGFCEVIFLVILSVIGERENIGLHVIFFYLMGLCGFIFYISNIICHSQSLWYLNPYGRLSYYIKIITTCLYFISMPILFTAFYLYWKKCITVMYDIFALTEYTDFFLNITYHCCAFLDIRHKVIFSIRNVKPADKVL